MRSSSSRASSVAISPHSGSFSSCSSVSSMAPSPTDNGNGLLFGGALRLPASSSQQQPNPHHFVAHLPATSESNSAMSTPTGRQSTSSNSGSTSTQQHPATTAASVSAFYQAYYQALGNPQGVLTPHLPPTWPLYDPSLLGLNGALGKLAPQSTNALPLFASIEGMFK